MARSATASSARGMDSPLRSPPPGVSDRVQETYTGSPPARPTDRAATAALRASRADDIVSHRKRST